MIPEPSRRFHREGLSKAFESSTATAVSSTPGTGNLRSGTKGPPCITSETSLRRAPGLASNLQGPPPPPCDDDKVDDCVHEAWWNYWGSPLIRLPDALLVGIMVRLDEDDILRLRHTSRTFMRLFSQSNAFQKLHLTNDDDENLTQHLARVWAVPRRSILIPNQEHQRREPNNDERICIGRERSLPLCSHTSVTWEMVNLLADRSPGKNTIICNHKQHVKEVGWIHSQKGPEVCSTCPHDDKPRLKAWRSDDGDLCIETSATVHLQFEPFGSRRGRVESMALRYYRVTGTLEKYFGE
ncbi:hypothetical protein CSOJ01_05550 [Colletotrichum sojae]|uniref:F-box domain-containing protein n=1 Tax=Colletotrichum sojae TaxID=2175907 RepID=A0A8H6JEY6_9PEZI|nr:hypothetical protein CSOJ01_05550 [Colletotrichum sojae]